MNNQDVFTPSETVLLNGVLFAESQDTLHKFPLPLPGDQRFADEKALAIKMLTVAFFTNLEKGFITVRKVDNKSVLQDDPYMVLFSNEPQWPKDTLEHRMLLCAHSKPGVELTLYQVFDNIYPRPVYDNQWRDICWDVCNGLYQRDLLQAETVELSVWARTRTRGNKFRVGKYLPLQEYSYAEETRDQVTYVSELLVKAENDNPTLWKSVQERILQPKGIK